MHHERCDGSGYPFGLKADKIDAFARLVAIADVYDATTSARIYRGPLCPFEVIGLFQSEGIQKYDKTLKVSSTSIGGKTSTNAVKSVFADRSNPP